MKPRYNVQRCAFTTAFLLIVSSALLVLFTACASAGANMAVLGANSVAAAAVTTKPMPPTQTSCPTNGQGRAAVMAPLAHSNQQVVVYVDTSSAKGILKSYNVSTKQTTILTSVSGGSLVNAQVSTDGQYVMFITGRKLQMLRIDGQGLQTLYCYPQSASMPGNLTNLLWSPNQRLAVFEEPPAGGGPEGPVVRLLNLDNGHVQTLAYTFHSTIQLVAWHGNTQVYYTIYYQVTPSFYNNVYALNINAPVNKNSTEVASIAGNLWDMNLTPDNGTLILSQCGDAFVGGKGSSPQFLSVPPSLISAQPAQGGVLRFIYGSHVHVVVQARISNQGLLFVIEDSTMTVAAQDGLWKINLDDTGLTRLLSGHTILAATHTTWANVSRNGLFYAAINQQPMLSASTTNMAYVGSLNGGAPQSFAATSDTIAVAGWAIR